MFSQLFSFGRKLCITHFRWSPHFTHLFDSWFHLASGEGRGRAETPLICSSFGRKSEPLTKSNLVPFFSLYMRFWLMTSSKNPFRTQQFTGTYPRALSDCHLLRVNKWTLLGNLFPFSAVRFTPYYEIKRNIVGNINYNDNEELLNLVEKKEPSSKM